MACAPSRGHVRSMSVNNLSILLNKTVVSNAPDAKTRFLQACVHGDIAVVKRLLRQGVGVEHTCEEFGSTGLVKAAMLGHERIVQLLLLAGADPNHGNAFLNTALHLNAQEGNARITGLLLSAGGNVNAQGQDKMTPLMIAAREGNVAVARSLLAAGANPDMTNSTARTAVEIAVENGSLSISALVLEAKQRELLHTQQRALSLPAPRSPMGVALSPLLEAKTATPLPSPVSSESPTSGETLEREGSCELHCVDPHSTWTAVKRTQLRLRAVHMRSNGTENVSLSDEELTARWTAVLNSCGTCLDLVAGEAAEEIVELVRAGVPSAVRKRVWMFLAGALTEQRHHHRDSFRAYHTRYLLDAEALAAPDRDIAKDVHRTLPNHPVFKEQDGRERLRRVLSAYSVRRMESIGYCQSMNVLGAVLLIAGFTEEEAFWMLAALIEPRMGYYGKTMCGLHVDQAVFWDLLRFLEPVLADHLDRLEVTSASFAVQWFLCLFMQSPLPLDEGVRFWDLLFAFGDELLFHIGLALLRSKKEELLSFREPSDALMFLLHGQVVIGVDFASLLNEVQQKTGTLTQEISCLRAFHRDAVLLKHRRLDEGNAAKLCSRLGFDDPCEIQALWVHFLAPCPWKALTTSALSDFHSFHRAFAPVAFVPAVRRQWRAQGLFSGIFERLFAVLDRSGRGVISFEMFLSGVALFRKSTVFERAAFCFRFFDLDGNGVVSRGELTKVFTMLHFMFNGRHPDKAATEAAIMCTMIFDKAAQFVGVEEMEGKDKPEEAVQGTGVVTGGAGLTLSLFTQVIAFHPLACLLFAIEELHTATPRPDSARMGPNEETLF